jgi:transposase
MYATTVGVDLAKNRFEVAVADEQFRVGRRERLTRARFSQFFSNRPPSLIVMEACGSAHYWARTFQARGHEVRLLPAQYVRAYVRRNKTDAADAAALIEASRCIEIRPVPIKSIDQQVLQQLHRVREQWKHTRTARINQLRGCLREFGIAIPVGAHRGILAVREALQCADNALPDVLRPLVLELLQEIAELEQRLKQIERLLSDLTHEDPVVRELLKIPGIGLLSATALRGALNSVQRFPSGRHFASWLGVTAREHSSGERRRLGAISKRGDVYLRTLLIHGARAVLQAAKQSVQAGRSLDRLRTWALQTERRCGHNKAIVALANKMARIIWATWKHQRSYDGNWQRRSSAQG